MHRTKVQKYDAWQRMMRTHVVHVASDGTVHVPSTWFTRAGTHDNDMYWCVHVCSTCVQGFLRVIYSTVSF